MKAALMIAIQSLWSSLRGKAVAVGPYLLVELVLPGGSLIALLLWLYNHRSART